jgi:hypothetical protein
MLQHFMVKKLMMEKKGPNLPAVYEQVMLESDIFKPETYDYVINLPINDVKRQNNSRIKRTFIILLGTLCYNDPTQISKVIDNKVLEKMIDMIMKCFPVDPFIMPTCIEFVRMITIHEKGKEIVKAKNIFKRILEPAV